LERHGILASVLTKYPSDGNAWFDDYNFPVKSWHRGLQYIANWAKKHPNVVSMSLRNELRRAINTTAPTSTTEYNWLTFVGNYTAATDAIHSINPEILVTWSGLQYDQDLSALYVVPTISLLTLC
jgi:endoglucanase